MSDQYVLDASALLALINKETGSDKVAKILSKCIMSTINLAEVASVLTSLSIPHEKIKGILNQLIEKVIPFDKEQAFEVAFLRNLTKGIGLSLGDRACIALGRLKNLPVITADKIWATVECGIEIQLIR